MGRGNGEGERDFYSQFVRWGFGYPSSLVPTTFNLFFFYSFVCLFNYYRLPKYICYYVMLGVIYICIECIMQQVNLLVHT